MRHAAKITDAKLQALGGNKQGVSTLNAVNMLGWTGDTMNEGLAKSIWNDKLKVSYGDTEGYGEYKLGGDTLLISSTLLGGGAEDSAKLAAVFAHEGTHAFGNRVEGIAHMQAAGTYDVINRMFDLKADGQFSNEMINGMLDSRSWVENTGDTDYWRVTLDDKGKAVSVLDDGDKDVITVVDESGNILDIRKIQKTSLSGQIADIVSQFQNEGNTQDKTAINKLMVTSGLDFDASKGGWYAKENRGIYSRTEADRYSSVVSNMQAAMQKGGINYLTESWLTELNNKAGSYIDISQENVEKKIGLDDHSACAITASAEMNNNFLKSELGKTLESQELIEAISNAQGEMFTDKSWVLSFNGLNAKISAALGIDNYLMYAGTYGSQEEVKAAGFTYYLEKATYFNDPYKTHFMSYSNGFKDDTDTTTNSRWWKDQDFYTSVYYGFTPKYTW